MLNFIVRMTATIAAVAAVCILLPFPTLATGAHLIPSALYPPQTRISRLEPLSNQQMDCDWSFACHDGQPLLQSWIFHLRTQDDLHRLSGWAQFGDASVHARRILFAVFASRYGPDTSDGLPWNVAAFSDFRGATLSTRYQDLEQTPRLLPKGALGNTSVQQLRSRSGDAIAMACWVGSIEVEGIALYTHGATDQRNIAVRSLTRQMRNAAASLLAE